MLLRTIWQKCLLLSSETGGKVGEVGMKNCRNCGAPLNKNGNCEYCGTVEQESGVCSYMEITVDAIRFGTIPKESLRESVVRKIACN